MLVALRAGHIVARYAKLHLYDAFSMQESQSIDAGTVIAPVLDVEGVKVGLMTCYDLRFPDMALALALQGADVLALPTGWVRGPLKEQQWSTLLAARALDTTSYMIAAGSVVIVILVKVVLSIRWGNDSRGSRSSGADRRGNIQRTNRPGAGATSSLQQRRFAPPQLL